MTSRELAEQIISGPSSGDTADSPDGSLAQIEALVELARAEKAYEAMASNDSIENWNKASRAICKALTRVKQLIPEL